VVSPLLRALCPSFKINTKRIDLLQIREKKMNEILIPVTQMIVRQHFLGTLLIVDLQKHITVTHDLNNKNTQSTQVVELKLRLGC
jgi:hypothetical protein